MFGLYQLHFKEKIERQRSPVPAGKIDGPALNSPLSVRSTTFVSDNSVVLRKHDDLQVGLGVGVIIWIEKYYSGYNSALLEVITVSL